MTSPRLSLAVLGLLCLTPTARAQTTQHGLRVPAGFEVTEFAGSDLANDIYCMTLDPQGPRRRLRPRLHPRLLDDRRRRQGRARRLDFAGAPKDGAMGLFWEGDDLYCIGDGGLRRYRDAGGAGRSNRRNCCIPFKTGGEHDAHAIRRGPDGWLYVLCGNNTGIKKSHATLPTSPIKEPVAGCVLRFPPDFKGCEIVADGFRNAYGMDFNADGELFTFDSDNERCVSLPWYEPTRLLPRRPRRPLRLAEPAARADRGGCRRTSPTWSPRWRRWAAARRPASSATATRSSPSAYRGGLFLLDWTFGRVYFVQLTRSRLDLQGASRSCSSKRSATTASRRRPRPSIRRPATCTVHRRPRHARGGLPHPPHRGVQDDEGRGRGPLQPAPRSLDWRRNWRRDVAAVRGRRRPARRRNALDADATAPPSISTCSRSGSDGIGERRRRRTAGCGRRRRALLAALGDAERNASRSRCTNPAALRRRRALSAADTERRVRPCACGCYATKRPRRGCDSTPCAWCNCTLGDLDGREGEGHRLGRLHAAAARRRPFPMPCRAALRAALPVEERRPRPRIVAHPGHDRGRRPRHAGKGRRPSHRRLDPVEDVHYLIVAGPAARRSGRAAVTRRVADGLLSLDRKLAAAAK